jgi:ABC-type transport system substrate-binding protein/tRNA A-37 threonylcarbamoyl transferase component Bud32
MAGRPPIGSVVAGYRLISLVGTGATGAVYLAEHEDTADRVALKLLDPELARDERFRQRMLRESQIAASLDHPHVVPIVGFGEADGVLYLAMRFIDGSDLRELLTEEAPLDPDVTLDLLGQVAGALDEAHARGLVHRDVKPANILVEGDTAYLSDFGLAKLVSSTSNVTGEHSFVGTIAYVSPEQIKGEEVDGRADVYSLGCVLYECLAGEPPFERDSDLAVVYAHLNERAPRLTETRPELPAGLDDVIRMATAKEPGDRFESCTALVAAARRALAGERIARRRRARAAFAIAAGLALIAWAIVSVAGRGGGGGGHPVPPVPRLAVGGPGIALLNASTRRVEGRVSLAERPSDLLFAGSSAWALLGSTQRLAEIDIARRKQVGSVKLPFVPGGVAAAGDSLFVTEDGGPGLARIAAGTRRITGRWTVDTHGPVTSNPTGIATGAGSVWVTRGAEVVRVNAANGRVQHRFPLTVTATLVTFADGNLWAASSANGLVEKIDPEANQITAHAPLHGWISALTVANGSVWATVTPDDVVFRLNEDDASVAQTLPAGAGPASLSGAPGRLWLADSRGRALTAIDTRSGVRTSLPLSGSPELVRARDGLLWTVAEPAPPALGPTTQGPVVRVALTDDSIDADPATGVPPFLSQLLYSTCVKLVNYPDATGAAGAKLVPDAATALPTVSPDGRTYTFQIRPGIRFSPPSGEPLTADTFRRTIERTLSTRAGPDPIGLHVVSEIVGARAFSAGRARHIRGIVARGDQLTITLSQPEGDLLSRLAQPLFCAVPVATPDPGSVSGPIASAGPYYIRSQTASETVLDRNPNYRGTRPRRPARIIYLTGLPTARAVALAGAGQVDLVTWDFDLLGPLAPGGALDRKFGNDPAAAKRDGSPRYHVGAAPGVDMLAFNTGRPLFKDPRLRRAVNYAIDRRALAGVYNETPTDRYVPPVVPMPRAAPVYPLSPDLATAKRLMPDTRKRIVSVYTCGEPVNVHIGGILRANLRPLNIDVSIIQSLDCLRGPDPKARQADIVLSTRADAELDPAPFMDATVGLTNAFGGGSPVTYDSPAFRAQLDAARRLSGDARLAEYARLEDELLRGDAPYASYGAFVEPEYLSARVGCRLVQGAYDVIDLGALCLRRG